MDRRRKVFCQPYNVGAGGDVRSARGYFLLAVNVGPISLACTTSDVLHQRWDKNAASIGQRTYNRDQCAQ